MQGSGLADGPGRRAAASIKLLESNTSAIDRLQALSCPYITRRAGFGRAGGAEGGKGVAGDRLSAWVGCRLGLGLPPPPPSSVPTRNSAAALTANFYHTSIIITSQ